MLELVLRFDGITRLELRVGVTTVGRASACDLVISHPTVSRRHAEFDYNGEHCVVTDLGSRSGTLLNGSLVKEADVVAGDVLTLGDVQVHVEAKREAGEIHDGDTGVYSISETATGEHDQEQLMRDYQRRLEMERERNAGTPPRPPRQDGD
jgi:pSer/pThr/pTyr-binding forkhead associated (FHA) protein